MLIAKVLLFLVVWIVSLPLYFIWHGMKNQLSIHCCKLNESLKRMSAGSLPVRRFSAADLEKNLAEFIIL